MNNKPKIAVAPMIDWTDRHCRAFHRAMSQTAVLYTEMIVDKAVINGDGRRLLDADAPKENVVLQLGGSEPDELAAAVCFAADLGYAEINLNCGCPSDRVQSGTFGAVMMDDPEKTARAVEAMIKASDAKISVKCRLGIDDQVVEESLPKFLKYMVLSGVQNVTIHARKAWLKGLSPKENREVPPLDYELAQSMISAFPSLNISLNGGIGSLDEAAEALDRGFEMAMIGRAAYQRPFDILAGVDAQFGGVEREIDRDQVVEIMAKYAADHIQNGGRLHQITRHMMGLYHGLPGGRRWRQILSENATKSGATEALLFEAVPSSGSQIEPQFEDTEPA